MNCEDIEKKKHFKSHFCVKALMGTVDLLSRKIETCVAAFSDSVDSGLLNHYPRGRVGPQMGLIFFIEKIIKNLENFSSLIQTFKISLCPPPPKKK